MQNIYDFCEFSGINEGGEDEEMRKAVRKSLTTDAYYILPAISA